MSATTGSAHVPKPQDLSHQCFFGQVGQKSSAQWKSPDASIASQDTLPQSVFETSSQTL